MKSVVGQLRVPQLLLLAPILLWMFLLLPPTPRRSMPPPSMSPPSMVPWSPLQLEQSIPPAATLLRAPSYAVVVIAAASASGAPPTVARDDTASAVCARADVTHYARSIAATAPSTPFGFTGFMSTCFTESKHEFQDLEHGRRSCAR